MSAGTKASRELGQATVELALVLPLVVVLLLGVVQVALVVKDQVMVTHAAREAAREAAVEPTKEAARRAAVEGAPLDPKRLEVRLNGSVQRGERVEAALSYKAVTSAPLVGPLLPDPTLRATASMRVE